MEIRTMRNFLVVADEGNITAAAAKLHLSQPSLSRQIQALEKELGMQLFVRKSHQVTLTQEGSLLRRRAKELVALADKIEQEAAAMKGELKGSIYFGAAETDSMRLVARAFERMQETYPAVKLRIFSGNSYDLVPLLDQGSLDFALLSQPVNTDKYTCLDLPRADEWVAYLRHDHPLAAHDVITPDDLRGQRLIVSRQAMARTAIRGELLKWFDGDLGNTTVVADFNLAYNGAVLAKEGVGILVTFSKLVDVSRSSGLVARRLDPPAYSALTVAYQSRFHLSRVSATFLDYLEEEFATDA